MDGSNTAYSGDYKKSFQFLKYESKLLRNKCRQSTCSQTTIYYVSSYLSLMDSEYKTDNLIITEKSDYPKAYALYLFDIQSLISGNIMNLSPSDHIRLNVRFDEALKETINIIVLCKIS